jgi:hypothetical protein
MGTIGVKEDIMGLMNQQTAMSQAPVETWKCGMVEIGTEVGENRACLTLEQVVGLLVQDEDNFGQEQNDPKEEESPESPSVPPGIERGKEWAYP